MRYFYLLFYLFVVAITFFCTHLFYLWLFFMYFPVSTDELSCHANKASWNCSWVRCGERSVIFKHREECVSGKDSVRVVQKERKFKSHAEILREGGAYVTVAFQYSCPKCWLKESQFHLMFFFFFVIKNRHTAKMLGEFSLQISVTSEARKAFQVPLWSSVFCFFNLFPTQ